MKQSNREAAKSSSWGAAKAYLLVKCSSICRAVSQLKVLPDAQYADEVPSMAEDGHEDDVQQQPHLAVGVEQQGVSLGKSNVGFDVRRETKHPGCATVRL